MRDPPRPAGDPGSVRAGAEVSADRRRFALAHPLNEPGQDLAPYRVESRQPDGNLLLTVLAVDR